MGQQADNCRVMVRVYANMLGLSKALARAGMVGHEARSLSLFASGFNRAEGLFDFVDAADKKEGSDFKIRGRHSCQKMEGNSANQYFERRDVSLICRSQSMSAHLLCRMS
jgi:hypothetical protein